MTDSPHPFDRWTCGGLQARYHCRQWTDGTLEYQFTPGPPAVLLMIGGVLLLLAAVFGWHTFSERHASLAFNLPILLCLTGAGLALMNLQKRLQLKTGTGELQAMAALFIFSAEETFPLQDLRLRVLPGRIRRGRNSPGENWFFLRLETPSGFHAIHRDRSLDRVMEEVAFILGHCPLELDVQAVRRELAPEWLARFEPADRKSLAGSPEEGGAQTGVRLYSPTLDAASFQQAWQALAGSRLRSKYGLNGLEVRLPWLRVQKNAGLLVIPALFVLGLLMMYFEFSSAGRVSGKSTLITIFFTLVTGMVVPHLLVSERLTLRNGILTYSLDLLGLLPVHHLSLPAGVVQEVNLVADATGEQTHIGCVLHPEMDGIRRRHRWLIVWNLLDIKNYPGLIILSIAHGLGGDDQRLLVSLLRGLTRDQKDGFAG